MAQAGLARARHRILVLNEDGRPAAHAMVSVLRSSVPFPEVALLTDDSGGLELSLPPGTYVFRAQGSEGTSGEVEVTSPGAVDSVIRLRRR